MIDVNWDLAPDGAVELKLLMPAKEVARFFNCQGQSYVLGNWEFIGGDWKAIATRPTQTKTVADAVEYYPNGWPKHMDDELWFSEAENRYMRRIEVLPKHKAYFVCDYLQFEAYVKEQEGEKWTHKVEIGFGNLHNCKVISSKGDFAWVDIDDVNEPMTFKVADLKPIKPTMTKADFADFVIEKLNDGTHQDAVCYLLQQKLDSHEII